MLLAVDWLCMLVDVLVVRQLADASAHAHAGTDAHLTVVVWFACTVVSGTAEEYTHVTSTIAADQLVDILPRSCAVAREELDEIDFSSFWVVNLGYAEPMVHIDGIGYFTPTGQVCAMPTMCHPVSTPPASYHICPFVASGVACFARDV